MNWGSGTVWKCSEINGSCTPGKAERDLCKTPPFEVCAYLANPGVRLKFQSSKY